MNVYIPYTRLPSAYQEVEYIQSSGTQYIVIGTSFKTSYKVVIDFQMDVIGGDYVPIGIRYTVGSTDVRYGINPFNSYFYVNGGSNTWTTAKAEDKNRHTITLNKNTATVDGTNYTMNYTNYTFSQGIGLFCYNEYDRSPQYNYKSSNKLYKLDIYDENGNHIHNIVPCYRKSDNVIGLYDLANNQFYTNSGTGIFSKGSDVNMTELKNAYIGEVWTPGSNTIAYYPLTSTSTVNDMSGNGYDLTNYGATFGTYQGVDCAEIYDRTKYISGDISTSVTGANPRTYNFWVYNSRATAYLEEKYFFNGVEGQSDKMVLFYINSGNDSVSQRGSGASFGTALRQQWINLCLVYDGTKFTLYRNGTQEGNSWTYTINTQGTTLRLGGPRVSGDGGWDTFEGYMSRFIFENKARTAQEVQNYYNQTKSTYGL